MKKHWTGNAARNWFIRVALFVCLAAPLAGQTDEWQKYKNELGNFSALLPGEPKDSLNGDQSEHVSHLIQLNSGLLSYSVVYVITQEEQRVDEETFKPNRDLFFKGLPMCDVPSEDPASPPIHGYVGRSYHLNCTFNEKKMNSFGNLYWGKHYFYIVMGFYPPGDTMPAEIKKFTDSFAVLDASK
ncbi:MAG TPA: hypothetical protein VG033_02365 [Candidatus Acidoferrales bacterium]|nr:hypothetical protein [Candidatus Acidoferrales bacterium]